MFPVDVVTDPRVAPFSRCMMVTRRSFLAQMSIIALLKDVCAMRARMAPIATT